jgi:hypothetical protein
LVADLDYPHVLQHMVMVTVVVTAGMVDLAALYLELPEGLQHFMTAAAFGNQVSPPSLCASLMPQPDTPRQSD